MSILVDLIAQEYQLVKIGTSLLTTEEHDSLRIWTDNNPRWYWYSRGIGGGVKEWLKYNNYSNEEKEFYLSQDEPNIIIDGNDDQYIDYDFFIEHGIGNQVYTEYIKSRNINKETCEAFQLETINKNTIIPIFHINDKRIGSLIRQQKSPKYIKYYIEKPLPFWNSQNFNYTLPTLIFEGAWSVMRFWQISKEMNIELNLLAGLSFHIVNEQFEYLNGLDNVIWLLDYDVNHNGELLNKVHQKRNKIKENNKHHRVIINRTMPDEMEDESIKVCLFDIIDKLNEVKIK